MASGTASPHGERDGDESGSVVFSSGSVVSSSFCRLPFLVNASDSFAFVPFPIPFALSLAFAFVPWRKLALVRIV